jgi:ribosome-associated protein
VIISLENKSTIADFMMVASGTSQRQVGAMAEHLMEKLKAAGIRTAHVEGTKQGDWVLIDAGDVIVHLFRPEIRTLYNLEKLWGRTLPGSEHAAELIA